MQLSKQDWELYVSGFDSKIQSMRAYCREKGISYPGFLYWQKRLLGNSKSSPDQIKGGKPCFLPLHLKKQNLKTAGQGRLRLKLNDITIVVCDDDFSPELLRQTLTVIRSC